jgi:GNAT superfamily N-acetyltransferase
MSRPRIIRIDDPTEAHRQAILRPLDEFSDPRAGERHWPEETLCLAIRGPDGAVRGGLWGRFYYDWLFVELLYIPPDLRGHDLGTALLAMAETRARGWGAVGIWLDTFSFQARGFYEKQGFTVFGEIADYPAGHQRFYLQKRLDTGAPPPAVSSHPLVEDVREPSPYERAAIGNPLEAFNDSQLGGGEWPDRGLAFLLADETGAVIGGLWGRSYYEWFYIGLLFVPESLRGQGVGTWLLALFEDEARATGSTGIWLDTFSFQAPDFYPRHGFVPFGQLTAYPGRHTRTFFTKRLR